MFNCLISYLVEEFVHLYILRVNQYLIIVLTVSDHVLKQFENPRFVLISGLGNSPAWICYRVKNIYFFSDVVTQLKKMSKFC